MKKYYLKYLAFFIGLAGINSSLGQITTFNYTGGVQTYIVPAGVTSVNIKTWGAQGVIGGGDFGGAAGLG